MTKITNPKLLASYQTGFNHVEELIRGINHMSVNSAEIYFDAAKTANEEQLANVRAMRTQVEVEIKKFLAYANSKLDYYVGLEQYLVELQAKTEELAAEAMAVKDDEQQEK